MKRKTWIQIFLHIILIAGLIIVVLPMVYMISTSLKPNGALYEYPPRFLPALEEVTLENYKYVLGQGKFYRNFLNSMCVSVASVLIAAAIASALGYVIARFDFPGKNFLFGFIVLTMIVPGLTLIVPQYELAVKLRVINSLVGLVPFYAAWTIPYSTFMIKGFVEGIPRELDEATSLELADEIFVAALDILHIFNHRDLVGRKTGNDHSRACTKGASAHGTAVQLLHSCSDVDLWMHLGGCAHAVQLGAVAEARVIHALGNDAHARSQRHAHRDLRLHIRRETGVGKRLDIRTAQNARALHADGIVVFRNFHAHLAQLGGDTVHVLWNDILHDHVAARRRYGSHIGAGFDLVGNDGVSTACQ